MIDTRMVVETWLLHPEANPRVPTDGPASVRAVSRWCVGPRHAEVARVEQATWLSRYSKPGHVRVAKNDPRTTT